MPTQAIHNTSVETLIEFGLSEKEAKIYLTILELEIAGVNDISKKAGVNRSSTYVVIESLKEKGLVSMTPDKKVQQYIAASPEMLLHIAKERNEKSAKVQKKIENMLPELRALHKETEYKPKVVVYEGDEATKMSYYSVFDSSEFRVFKDLAGMSEVVPGDYVENDGIKRKKGGVKMFLLSPDTKENQEIVKKYKSVKSPDEFTLIPPKQFAKSGKNIGVTIFNDRIKFASAKDKFAIFIINQAIADTLKDLFDLAWAESKRLNTDKNKKTR